MGAGVVLADGAIPTLAYHLVPQHQHGPHRDLADSFGLAGQRHGMAHPALVLLRLFNRISIL
ncbi:hypothetical protein D3C85_1940100 [compost metagenome]